MNNDEWILVDGQRWMEGARWNYDGRWTEGGQMSDETTMNIERNCDRYQMDWWKTSNRITMDVQWNGNWTERNGRQLRCRAIRVCELYDDGVQKRRGKCFSSTSCFFSSSLLLFPELLQGLLTTWLQAKKHTRVHNPNVNLKTHV
jgi:hypothetical protein